MSTEKVKSKKWSVVSLLTAYFLLLTLPALAETKTIHEFTLATPATNDELLIWDVSASGTRKILASDLLALVTALPTQTGNSGKYLTTNGTAASWVTLSTGVTIGTTAITGGTSGRLLYDNAGVVGEMSLGTGVSAFLTTPSSANLAAALTDETGTGAAVFATNAVLTGPTMDSLSSLSTATGITFDDVTPVMDFYVSSVKKLTIGASLLTLGSNVGIDFAGTGAATTRTNLGLGTAATQASTNFAQVGNNLSDLSSAATARTNLGLAIGTNVQAYDADLTTYAGITPSANVQTFLGAANYAAMKTQLALTIGTDVQAYDADLTLWAATTPPSSYAVGDLLYASAANTLGKLADVATGSVLVSGGVGVAPAWSSAPQVTTLELGAVSDNTLSRLGAGRLGVEGVEVLTQTNTLTGITNKTFVAPGLGAATGTTLALGGSLLAANGMSITGSLAEFSAGADSSHRGQFYWYATDNKMYFGTASNTYPLGFQGSYSDFQPAGTQRVRIQTGVSIGSTTDPGAGSLSLAGTLIGTPQALTTSAGAGAVNVTTLSTEVTTTGVADALSLANGTSGQIKTIIHKAGAFTSVLTPTSALGFTTITFGTALGQSVTLQYTSAGWVILAINGAVAA